MHHDDNVEAIDGIEAQVVDSSLDGKPKQSRSGRLTSTMSLLKNWQLVSPIILYCIFSLYDTAYYEVNFYLGIIKHFQQHCSTNVLVSILSILYIVNNKLEKSSNFTC
jgi:hypothetical protein